MIFDLTYSRGPFFLKGRQVDIDEWYASMGLPNDAQRWQVNKIKKFNDAPIDALYEEAGCSPRNKEATDTKIWADTMTAHRLAQYAATESSEKGELVWIALSRRFFMGKDTQLRPIKLDDHRLLMECAEFAGLDLDAAQNVLLGHAFEDQVLADVERVRRAGIHSIPLFAFEVGGAAKDSFLTGVRTPSRQLHHGSGSKASFRAVLQQLYVVSSRR